MTRLEEYRASVRLLMFPETSANDPEVLTCWKDIANYLGKGVRTVQRWERDLGMPIRRPNGIDHKSAVMAYTRDLDAWLQSGWAPRQKEEASARCLNEEELEIRNMIQTSRVLRKTASNLVHEMSEALTRMRTLIQWRNQLSKYNAFANIRLAGQNGDLLSETCFWE